MIEDYGLEYIGLEGISGPLVFVEKVCDVAFDEVVEITGPDGTPRIGTVIEVATDHAVVQVLEGTTGLSNAASRIRFLGKPLAIEVSKQMLGRVFDGLGRPADGLPPRLHAQAWRTCHRML